jgi:hypothetical protein
MAKGSARSQYQEASDYKSNVDATNSAMGYHNMADRANNAKKPGGMQGAKVRKQEMGKPKSGSASTGKDY